MEGEEGGGLVVGDQLLRAVVPVGGWGPAPRITVESVATDQWIGGAPLNRSTGATDSATNVAPSIQESADKKGTVF